MPGTYYVNGDGHNVAATGSGNQITVGLTGITQHTVQVGGASNALTQIANGTTGQVLTATTGADPSWQAAGGGAPANNCCFYAYINASITGVTGDGTAYDIPFNATLFDNGSNFNTGTGVFTAPVTGNYYLNTLIQLNNLGIGHNDATINFNVNSGTIYYQVAELNPFVIASSTALVMAGSIVVALNANDTVVSELNISGSTKTVDVIGSASTQFISPTSFQGYLLTS